MWNQARAPASGLSLVLTGVGIAVLAAQGSFRLLPGCAWLVLWQQGVNGPQPPKSDREANEMMRLFLVFHRPATVDPAGRRV
ncbi:hypothetical protein CUV01_18130 [Paracoccus tegillarcae]|uniref:Uncharacterized protein n=1 Tax=Paracoccus tegillarcae TaxID=1529068 RepID=A0A2K9EKT7_9RHOB|nr:hypothetical protein CUV01_18130 [Paracoccus tegillarcae]